MYRVISDHDELKFRSEALLVSGQPFQKLSLRDPRFSPPELGFYQVVAWLFGLYYEAGHVSFAWMLRTMQNQSIDGGEKAKTHYEDVRCLRTYLYHNLILESPHDSSVQAHCHRWFDRQCGSILPGDDPEWTECLCALLSDAHSFLGSMRDYVRLIERDDSRKDLLADWEFRLKRFHPRYEFEQLIDVVSKDLGQGFVDAGRLCQKYFDDWSAKLRSLTGDYDFGHEARKLIEHTLIYDNQVPLPITGNDIISRFQIRPGQEVGILLRKARILYEIDPCPSDELLIRLENQLVR